MRIILTENGQKIIQKLTSSNSAQNLLSNINKIQNIKEKQNKLNKNRYNSIKIKNTFLSNNISSNNSVLFSSNNNIKILGPKLIKLKKRKLKMPLSFVKRYEKKYEQNSSSENIIMHPINILSTLENKNNNFNTNKNIKNEIKNNNNNYNTADESKLNNSNSYILSNNSSSIFLPRLKSHYSLQEIIPKKCLDDYDTKLKEKINEEKYDLICDYKILRKKNKGEDMFDEFEKIKNKKINVKNYKLIEYLLEQKNISKALLQRIKESDEKKIQNLNRLSGQVLEKNELEKIFNKRIKDKVDNKLNKDSMDIRRSLLQIKLKVNDSIKDTQINKYSLIKENKKFIYRNIFEKFREKFWKKSNNYARYFIKNRSVSYNKI